jgi:hypothetical protein
MTRKRRLDDAVCLHLLLLLYSLIFGRRVPTRWQPKGILVDERYLVLKETYLLKWPAVIKDVGVARQQSSKLGLVFCGKEMLDLFPSDLAS